MARIIHIMLINVVVRSVYGLCKKGMLSASKTLVAVNNRKQDKQPSISAASQLLTKLRISLVWIVVFSTRLRLWI